MAADARSPWRQTRSISAAFSTSGFSQVSWDNSSDGKFELAVRGRSDPLASVNVLLPPTEPIDMLDTPPVDMPPLDPGLPIPMDPAVPGRLPLTEPLDPDCESWRERLARLD